jgi:two-component system CheB/CheR fusion protein
MKFLLVDDDASFLKSLQLIVESLGHSADCATTADEGLALLKDQPYDISLVDYSMPEKSGLWFMEHANISGPTKVLLMTGEVDRKVIKKMFDVGVCGYLIKPFDADELAYHIDFHTQRA